MTRMGGSAIMRRLAEGWRKPALFGDSVARPLPAASR
jgi:hypothetical protein